MSQLIAQPADCCNECPPPSSTQIPGPKGDTGAPGTDGTNGIDALTTVALYDPPPQPVMPAEGGTVVVDTTSSTAFLSVGEPAFVETWGILKVTALGTNTVTLQNLRNTVSNLYPQNAAPGISLAAGAKIVPSGFNGANGAAAAGSAPDTASYITRVNDTAALPNSTPLSALATGLLKNTTATGVPSIATDGTEYLSPTTGLSKAGNLAGLASAATSRTNLGLGTAAVKDAGVANGNLPPVDTTFTNGNPVFATASGAQTKTPAAARAALGVLGGYGLLGSVIGQSLNSTLDISFAMPVSKYKIDRISLSNPSASLGTAHFQASTGAGGTGTVVALDQGVGALTAASKVHDLTLEAVAGTDYFSGANFHVQITTSQPPETVDIHIYGYDLS